MNQKRPDVLLLAKVRQLHSYFAMFAAPSILFFCLTGVLQLFSFHEAHGNYQPPAVLEALGSLHKDQALAVHHHGGQAPERAGKAADLAGPQDHAVAGHANRRPDKTEHWTIWQILLKLVFAAAAISAMVSAGLGIWVGLSFGLKRKLLAWVLAAGIAVPTLLAIAVAL